MPLASGPCILSELPSHQRTNQDTRTSRRPRREHATWRIVRDHPVVACPCKVSSGCQHASASGRHVPMSHHRGGRCAGRATVLCAHAPQRHARLACSEWIEMKAWQHRWCLTEKAETLREPPLHLRAHGGMLCLSSLQVHGHSQDGPKLARLQTRSSAPGPGRRARRGWARLALPSCGSNTSPPAHVRLQHLMPPHSFLSRTAAMRPRVSVADAALSCS